MKGAAKLAIFDSGLGGLTVLSALLARLSDAEFVYLADSAFAPYGDRSQAEIAHRVDAVAAFLMQSVQPDALVVACNTASSAAVHHLRATYPIPVIAMEPAVKPAVRATRNRIVAVMATAQTLRGEKFDRLLADHRGHAEVHRIPCPGLVQAIENDDLDPEPLPRLLSHYADLVRRSGADTLVLGCTHYPLVRSPLARQLPDVQVVDSAAAVAERVADLIRQRNLSGARPGHVSVFTTGDPHRFQQQYAHWMGQPTPAVQHANVATPDHSERR